MITFPGALSAALSSPFQPFQHLLTITGYSRQFNFGWDRPGYDAWIAEISGGEQKVNDLDGGPSISELTVKIIDRSQLFTGDLSVNTLEGATATLKIGYRNLDPALFGAVGTYVIERIESLEDATSYNLTLKRDDRLLQKIIYTAGDNGYPTSSKNPKTLSGNPMDLLTDALQNQVGLAAGQINSTAIANYKNGLWAGATMRFILTTAPHAKEWIDRELFRALGGYWYFNAAGQFTPVYLLPSALPVAALSLTEDSIEGVPLGQPAPLLNVVVFRFDDDGSKFNSEALYQDAVSVGKYGIQGSAAQHIIEAKGLRSLGQGWMWTKLLANMLTARYGYQNIVYKLKAFWPAVILEPGDYVTVTHSKVPNRTAGKLGISNVLSEVLGVKLDFRAGRVELELLDVSKTYSGQGAFQVAPDGEPAYASASAADRAKYMFVASASTGKYSTGDAGNKIL